jgi:hypothetical protein
MLYKIDRFRNGVPNGRVRGTLEAVSPEAAMKLGAELLWVGKKVQLLGKGKARRLDDQHITYEAVLASGPAPKGPEWNGMCPDNKHGLDYEGQRCDLCKIERFRKPAAKPSELTLDQRTRRERILQITERLVVSQIQAQEFDPDDEDALRQATREAVRIATLAYDAAREYCSG